MAGSQTAKAEGGAGPGRRREAQGTPAERPPRRASRPEKRREGEALRPVPAARPGAAGVDCPPGAW